MFRKKKVNCLRQLLRKTVKDLRSLRDICIVKKQSKLFEIHFLSSWWVNNLYQSFLVVYSGKWCWVWSNWRINLHQQPALKNYSGDKFQSWENTIYFFLIYFKWRLITLQYCIGFAIHQHESATGIHVFPILNPPPASLSVPSLWVVSVHQPQASSIMHWTWTGDLFHIWYYTCFSAILLNHKFGCNTRN